MKIFIVFLGLLGFFLYMVYLEEKKVDFCFMQEPRTKECDLVLYKYGGRKCYFKPLSLPVVFRQ